MVIHLLNLFSYDWTHVRKVFGAVVKKTLNEFPDDKSVEDVDASIARISTTMEAMGRPPYTIQRICEIILNPKEMYYNLKKYLFAVEKLATVNYTIAVLSPDDYADQVKNLYDTLQNLREPKETEER
uniref:Uncharacterized protein n=1 Tax=Paramoeba aestuarina TaxID=180227 RepID=A0A7S4L6J2_9EUKA